MNESNQEKYFCPRLIDYVAIVGSCCPLSKHTNTLDFHSVRKRRPSVIEDGSDDEVVSENIKNGKKSGSSRRTSFSSVRRNVSCSSYNVSNNCVTHVQSPELLRRFPESDHKDFALPTEVVYFCQPEGCTTTTSRFSENNRISSFVFTISDKDTVRTRYGVCLNFNRPVKPRYKRRSYRNSESSSHFSKSDSFSEEEEEEYEHQKVKEIKSSSLGNSVQQTLGNRGKIRSRNKIRYNTLTSLCLISHHPFFMAFRECLFYLKSLVDVCNESLMKGHNKYQTIRLNMWDLIAQNSKLEIPLVRHYTRELENWILRLLSAPVPVPGQNKIELMLYYPEQNRPPITFALPDSKRFSLLDFPIHLPFELLGVENCIKVLCLILLEYKVVFQSRDYNALSMSVLAFIALIYPLEYMFPVIPLLPISMELSECLLDNPTPYVVGIPVNFFLFKKHFTLPDDVWLVDLDANKIIEPTNTRPIPPLPQPEGNTLKRNLRQAIVNLTSSFKGSSNSLATSSDSRRSKGDIYEKKDRRESCDSIARWIAQHHNQRFSEDFGDNTENGLSNLAYENDPDKVDIAVRVAMVRFLNSTNTLANICDHIRTIRLFPRPVVAVQIKSFLQSLDKQTDFADEFFRTQAVEFFAEWSLTPTNIAFKKIITGIDDPISIGDKSKWFSQSLEIIQFSLWNKRVMLDDVFIDNFSNESADECNTDESDVDSYIDDEDISPPSSTNEKQISSSSQETIDKSSGWSSMGSAYDPPSRLLAFVAKSQNEESLSPTSSLLSVDSDHCLSEYIMSNSSKKRHSVDVPRTKINQSNKSLRRLSLMNQQKTIDDVFNSSIYRKSSKKLNNSSRMEMIGGTLTKLTDGTEEKICDTKVKTSSFNPFDNLTRFSKDVFADITKGGLFNLKTKLPKNKQSSSIFSNFFSSKTKNPSVPDNLCTFKSSKDNESCLQTNKIQSVPGNLSNIQTLQIVNAELTGEKVLARESPFIRHAGSKKSDTMNLETVVSIKTDNEKFLNEVVHQIMDDGSIGWLKFNRCKKLLEDEYNRLFILSKLNRTFECRISPTDYVEDMVVPRKTWRSMLKVLNACIQGLEENYNNGGTNSGIASAFHLLEIGHTHYWSKYGSQSSISGFNSQLQSPFSSHENLRSPTSDLISNSTMSSVCDSRKSSMEISGDYSTLNVPTITHLGVDDESLRTVNTIQSQRKCSFSRRSTISDGDIQADMAPKPRERFGSYCSTRSSLSVGPSYGSECGASNGGVKTEPNRYYLYEALLGKDKSSLWDNMQFWEDAFVDAVRHERDIIGMDRELGDTIEGFKHMNESEQKRLTYDEDRLLSTMLYNLIAFMLMMNVKQENISCKVRSLLGKCRIAIYFTEEITSMLYRLHELRGNDVELKCVASRLGLGQSFAVHVGTDSSGSLLFVEVRDDGLIMRSMNASINERWWYDRIINMTYSPRSKVVCLWKKCGGQTSLHKYYTKKSKELYFCIKSAMEKVIEQGEHLGPAIELGGEFPVKDISTGEGGVLQVCIEGVGLLFSKSKFFVKIKNIRKCYSVKGKYFILEEYIPKRRIIMQRKYESVLAGQICYSILCVFSFVASLKEKYDKKEENDAHTK